MSHRSFLKISSATAAILILLAGASGAASPVAFQSHDITIKLDVEANSAEFVDTGVVTTKDGQNFFRIAGDIKIHEFKLGGEQVEYTVLSLDGSTSLSAELLDAFGDDIDTTGKTQLVSFEANSEESTGFELKYSGIFLQDVADTRFSNEMVGQEITATISEKGAYFSSQACFYPIGSEDMCRFRLTADVPGEWESISDGNLVASEIVDGRKVQTWENPFASDGLTYFASSFILTVTSIDSIDVACYFFPEDSALIQQYLNASVDYIKMYSELIGPYPYKNFSVVENFFPTGYGMPGWTLLGQQVLRLPFIVGTSLGHEVLHNWWGNSVFVDYERGNWCEGLTVYGADYRYKADQSPNLARDYRRDILKSYVSYIDEGNDFPLREFTSRTSAGTRAIGYNKSMMVFHMIEELIGTEAFYRAWKDVYADYRGKKVSWEDWIASFEKTSGMDLSYVIPEWIDRPGAPVLAAQVFGSDVNDAALFRDVKFRLNYSGDQVYSLKVPVRLSNGTFIKDTTVILTEKQKDYEIRVDAAVEKLEVDPDCDLFRRLYPEEVEPIISAIMGNPEKQFLAYDCNPPERRVFEDFGLNMTGDSVHAWFPGDTASVGEGSQIVLNPDEFPVYFDDLVFFKGDSLVVDGKGYLPPGHTFIFAGQQPDRINKYLVILTHDFGNLARIGQLLPHYGKYSYLIFEGAKNIGKGQWQPGDSPMKIDLN